MYIVYVSLEIEVIRKKISRFSKNTYAMFGRL